MSGRVVKRACKYRFYPSPVQAGLLNRTFGSVRYVYLPDAHRVTGRKSASRPT